MLIVLDFMWIISKSGAKVEKIFATAKFFLPSYEFLVMSYEFFSFISKFRKYNHLDLEELKELSLRFAPLGVRANSLVDDHVNHSRNYRL